MLYERRHSDKNDLEQMAHHLNLAAEVLLYEGAIPLRSRATTTNPLLSLQLGVMKARLLRAAIRHSGTWRLTPDKLLRLPALWADSEVARDREEDLRLVLNDLGRFFRREFAEALDKDDKQLSRAKIAPANTPEEAFGPLREYLPLRAEGDVMPSDRADELLRSIRFNYW
jgi:hypothetical protein